MGSRNELLNDPEEALRIALDGRQTQIWTSMPGLITAVDFSKMTCSVQPAIQGIVQDQNGNDQNINLPLLVDVPIVFPSAGGFIITFPIKIGDEVLVSFSARCIDSWWQNGGIGIPLEIRMHDLSDGFAIPGPKSLPNVISGISSTNLQIRNSAGTSFIEISSTGKISIVSPSEIDVTAPLVKVTGALTVTGALVAATLATAGTGSATIGGSIIVTGEVTAEGIPLSSHKHTGVTTGLGDTGGPVP